jgi:hypothetical protein
MSPNAASAVTSAGLTNSDQSSSPVNRENGSNK